MKKSTLTLVLAALCLAGSAAQAVTINLNVGFLYENNGTTALPVGSTLVLLADTANNGFGNLSLSTGSFAPAVDDIVLDRWGLDGILAGDGTTQRPVSFNLDGFGGPAGLSGGDALMLVWYQTPYSALATGPGAGVFYGAYRTDSVLDGSDIAWNTPAGNGDTVSLNLFTQNTGAGSVPDSATRAQFQTIVPEPSTGMLVLGGLAFVGMLRRRS